MLSGIRIIEFEGLGPAPFASMLLADLGAEVITIHRAVSAETPGNTDRNPLDRGKRSIVLNLKCKEDLDVAKALLKTAHGLIEGLRPGVMERLGLGPDEILKINPKIVYGRMTGWGQDGPLSLNAGHDLNYIARVGALWYGSNPGDPPFTPPTLVGDIGGGAMYLVVGMLSGFLNVTKGNQGCVVDAAIVDGAAHMMSLLMSLHKDGGLQMARGHSTLDGPHWSRCYTTKDLRFISVQCIEPKFYKVFLNCLGLENDKEFLRQFDKTLWAALTRRLSSIFLTKSLAEWNQIFTGTDACVAPVLSPIQSSSDPHIEARSIWFEAEGHLQAKVAPRFSNWQPAQHSPIPQKDADRQSILDELNTRVENEKRP